MPNLSLRRSFVLFHCSLAIVIVIESISTVVNVLHHHASGPLGPHLALLAGLEGIAAVLFVLPKTLKAGSVLLLLIFAFAMLVHGIAHELDLIVFATGVLFVAVHGSAFSKDLLGILHTSPSDLTRRSL